MKKYIEKEKSIRSNFYLIVFSSFSGSKSGGSLQYNSLPLTKSFNTYLAATAMSGRPFPV